MAKSNNYHNFIEMLQFRYKSTLLNIEFWEFRKHQVKNASKIINRLKKRKKLIEQLLKSYKQDIFNNNQIPF